MKHSRFLILLLLVLFCCLKAVAQDSEYVYRDSSSMKVDSLTKSSILLNAKSISIDKDVDDDSALYQNQLAIAADSAEALKKLTSFGYAQKLDSILLAMQKKQQTEPVRQTRPSWLEIFFFSPVVKAFFWILALLFVGFVLYKLFFTPGFFQRNSYTDKVTAVIDKPEESFATTDYTRLINDSIAATDFRMAVRYLYLQTLQKLTSRNAISFAPAKTNNQYIQEVFSKPYKDEFVAVTLQYEYVWYGDFKLDETLFGKIQNNFKQFNGRL